MKNKYQKNLSDLSNLQIAGIIEASSSGGSVSLDPGQLKKIAPISGLTSLIGWNWALQDYSGDENGVQALLEDSQLSLRPAFAIFNQEKIESHTHLPHITVTGGEEVTVYNASPTNILIFTYSFAGI